MTQHLIALSGLCAQTNVPVKEEDGSKVASCLVASATSPTAFHDSKCDDSSRSEGKKIDPDPSDVICSLRDKEYKSALSLDINKLAEMGQRGEDLGIKFRADVILKQFKEKVGARGKYLKCSRSQTKYVEICEDDARKKIIADLRREALKKRSRSESSCNQSNDKKKSLKQSNDSNIAPNGSSYNLESPFARPKRGVQQLLYQNMPYIERFNVGRNPVGMPVAYDHNTDFKPKFIKTDKEKRVCAGQAFVRYLTANCTEWDVKKYQDEHGGWDYVTYKGCNKCNGKEQEAIEGKNKFTGYDALAKFAFSTGLGDDLIKKSKDITELFMQIGLSCSKPWAPPSAAVSASNGGDRHATPSETGAKSQTQQTQSSLQSSRPNHRSTPAAAQDNVTSSKINNNVASTRETPQDILVPIDMSSYLEKKNELVQTMKLVKNNLDDARSSCIGDEHVWKHNKAIDFYNTLQRSLTGFAKNRSAILSFKPDMIKRTMEAFNDDMSNLKEAEENGDESYIEFFQGIIESSIEEAKERFLLVSH